jgi:glycosyltransferase involved in cell wall biosynthesis
MSRPALVSIALCTFNGADYIKAQLDSLIAQTYTELEIIIVDDCSTDATLQIVDEYSKKYPCIKVYQNRKNLGYIKNFERAIGLCTGDFIALCDQDDIWDKNKISMLVANIGENILIYHDSEFINQDGRSLGKKVSDIRNCYSGGDSRVFLFENCISGHAMLFTKEMLKHFYGFNNVVMHDWWLAYIAANNGSVVFLNHSLVKYRQHQKASTNILRQNRGQKKQHSLKKIEKQLEITAAFAAYPQNTELNFKHQLLKLMHKRLYSYISPQLMFFVFKNRKTLLLIQKKSIFSKFNFILKFFWGGNVKKLLQ